MAGSLLSQDETRGQAPMETSMSDPLNLGTLGVTVNTVDGAPSNVTFALPDGSVEVRPFENGASSMLLGMNLGLLVGVAGNIGGGGGDLFAANWGVFDGASALSIASLAATDNSAFAFSFFVNVPDVDAVSGATGPVMAVDPSGVYASGLDINYLVGKVNAFVGNTTGDYLYLETDNGGINFENTVHIIGSAKTDIGAGNELVVYANGVLLNGVPFGSNTTFNVTTNGLPMFVGSSADVGTWLEGNLAEVWIAPGQSLLDGSNLIPAATIAKFRDAVTGDPVNLGANGETPTGVAPAIYFSNNNQDVTDFTVNRGTGGAFTIIGAITDGGAVG